jgi:Peptidase A4 family
MSERRIPKVLSNEETYKRLRVFRTPPEGFDPLKATKRQLTAYGLPHPPEQKTHPRQAALWREHMADRPEYIVPEFRIDRSSQRMGGYRRERGLPWAPPPDHPFFTFDKRFVTRPDLIRDDFLLIRNLSPQTSNNWSGAYVNQPPTEPFNNVYATFNVPYAQPPPSAWNGKSWTDGIYHAVTWVGLDGWNGPDVMQAGVMSQATVTKGSVSTMYYAWVEFFPTPWIQVANFPVSPGDMIALTRTLLPCSATRRADRQQTSDSTPPRAPSSQESLQSGSSRTPRLPPPAPSPTTATCSSTSASQVRRPRNGTCAQLPGSTWWTGAAQSYRPVGCKLGRN